MSWGCGTLRPYTTITIAEDKMMFPFDVSHLAVRKYQHLGDGIDFGEVLRMNSELVTALKSILENPQRDSPVYSFFADLEPPVRKKIQEAVAQSAPSAAPVSAVQTDSGRALDPTASALMKGANAAIAKSDLSTARTILSLVRDMAPRDPYFLQRFALATYKSKTPDQLRALQEAKRILNDLEPEASTDPETLGLWGAIHKRIWDLTSERASLETAIFADEKGFYVKNDYYNGINAAYLYNLRASISSVEDATADSVLAGRIRRRVLTSCSILLTKDSTICLDERYWILATMAEAWTGLGDERKAQELLGQAEALNQPSWMLESTNGQLAALKKLLNVRPGAASA
jgi:hypothetical protein